MSNLDYNYTGRTKEELILLADTYIKELVPEWINRDDNDVNWATIKTICWLLGINSMYIDLAVNEQNPYEVIFYSNALKLAKKFGYPVRKYTGATADLTLTLVNNTETVTLPIYTKFKTTDNLEYVSLSEVNFNPGEDVKQVSVKYGKAETLNIGSSTGERYQSFKVLSQSCQAGTLKVIVTTSGVPEEWKEVDSLIMSRADSKEYRLVLDSDENYIIYFGDNNCGMIPPSGSTISVEVITMPFTYITDNYGNRPSGNITICDSFLGTVTQPLPASGGIAKEDLEEISRNIPQWIATAGKVITPRDAEFLAKRVPGVAEAKVSVTVFDYDICIIAKSGVPTEFLKGEVQAYLDDRRLPQIGIQISSPVPAYINLTLDVKVMDNFSQSIVIKEIRSKLSALIEANSIGNTLRLLDVYKTLGEVSGIKTATVVKLFKDFTPEVAGDISFLANEYPVLEFDDPAKYILTISGGII